MRPRRGGTELSGVLLIDKPQGPTSHDVVATLRSATGERRIGHAGTLDPMATGLLVVLVGAATRLEQYLVGHGKRYEARIVFGDETDTLDADGVVTESAPIPETVRSAEEARRVLTTFLGEQEQMPPAYSAIKRDGVPAHRVARAGGEPELEPRAIEVMEAELAGIDPDVPAWDVRFAVSKGTYIRSLARDIGRATGSRAHLGALRRTRVGDARVESALALEAAAALARDGALTGHFADPVSLLGMPVIEVAPDVIRDGKPLPGPRVGLAEGDRVALATDELLLAIYRYAGDRLVPDAVLSPAVVRA